MELVKNGRHSLLPAKVSIHNGCSRCTRDHASIIPANVYRALRGAHGPYIGKTNRLDKSIDADRRDAEARCEYSYLRRSRHENAREIQTVCCIRQGGGSTQYTEGDAKRHNPEQCVMPLHIKI